MVEAERGPLDLELRVVARREAGGEVARPEEALQRHRADVVQEAAQEQIGRRSGRGVAGQLVADARHPQRVRPAPPGERRAAARQLRGADPAAPLRAATRLPEPD